MAVPLVTDVQVANAIKAMIPKKYRIEVYLEYPSEIEVVRYGIYVSDAHTIERTPYELGLTTGASIYHVRDQIKIVYISFQDDPYNIEVNGYISSLPTYINPSTNLPLFDGYHDRTFTQDVNYGTQASRHSWVYDLHRLEFQ